MRHHHQPPLRRACAARGSPWRPGPPARAAVAAAAAAPGPLPPALQRSGPLLSYAALPGVAAEQVAQSPEAAAAALRRHAGAWLGREAVYGASGAPRPAAAAAAAAALLPPFRPSPTATAALLPPLRPPQVRAPVLIVQGDVDAVVPTPAVLRARDRLAARPAGAGVVTEYVELQRVGHIPMEERPAEFVDAAAGFLGRTLGGGGLPAAAAGPGRE